MRIVVDRDHLVALIHARGFSPDVSMADYRFHFHTVVGLHNPLVIMHNLCGHSPGLCELIT